MSSRICKAIALFGGGLVLLGAVPVDQVRGPLISKNVEFARGLSVRAESPDGKSSINLMVPKDEDSDPVMEAISGAEKISLGDLQRSAFVFWKPDSSVAVLDEFRYSNRFLVRLIRSKPTLAEVKGFDQMIKQKVLKTFHPGKLIHYWPFVEGWTQQDELLIVVCADGVPPRSPTNTRLVGFERGYLIDTNSLVVRSELSTPKFMRLLTSNPCGN